MSCPAGSVIVQFDTAAAPYRQTPDGERITVPDNYVAVFGSLQESSFAVDSLENIVLQEADGTARPLIINNAGVYREFGEIVTVPFCVLLPESALALSDGWRLVWGSDVQSPNQTVDGWNLDDIPASRMRQLIVSSQGGAGTDDISVTSIEVIADSNARYYAIWYLLPMALIFLMLTIRKLTDDRVVRQASADSAQPRTGNSPR